MKIFLVGGGSGGHITPILSVADELKRQDPSIELVFVIAKGDKLANVPANHTSIDRVISVRAGKFRRYHGGGIRQLLDIPTQLKNLRDLLYFVIGFFQSLIILGRHRPSAVFIKGGFVGVPVGLAAAVKHIPYVTHDSDAVPGLANRIVARWASLHAVAMPVSQYKYSAAKTKHVGVPVNTNFMPLPANQVTNSKIKLGLSDAPVLLVTGGGLGALRLNHAIVHAMPLLLAHTANLQVVHIAGPGKADELKELYRQNLRLQVTEGQIHVYEFLPDLYRYSAVADVVVTRAGANSLADFAMQQKACVVVPNPQLTGGHQTKNAQALVHQEAIVLVEEDEITKDGAVLAESIIDLLDSKAKRQALGEALNKTVKTDAALQIANMLINVATGDNQGKS